MINFFDRMASQRGDTSDSTDTLEDADAVLCDVDESHGKTQSRIPVDVKRVTQELLKYGYVEESQKPELFRCARAYEPEILSALEPIDLEMRLDPYRGVAFLVVAKTEDVQGDDEDAWLHPLVRRQRLTLEQSLLCALLRQAFALHEQESGVGEGPVKLAIDDLLPQFMAYIVDSGSDAKNESRLLSLLDQLKSYGVVTEVDKKHEFVIRPLIAYLATPESLTALLQTFRVSAECHESVEETN